MSASLGRDFRPHTGKFLFLNKFKKSRIYQAFEIVSASAYVAIVSMLKACIDNFIKNKFAI